MTDLAPGQALRQAWIAGVHRHYPGTPKAGYVTPWEETAGWERTAPAAVERQVRDFVSATGGATARLSADQRGRFVALCWLGQIHKAFAEPKPSYAADWDDLPHWQRAVDIDVFDTLAANTTEYADSA